jgi:hypothetical protein
VLVRSRANLGRICIRTQRIKGCVWRRVAKQTGLPSHLALKANHLVNLKAAKSDLLSMFDCPNIPKGLWFNVLAHRFIDLTKVYSVL